MKVVIGPYKMDDKKRKVRVQIDGYDTWNADHTLALIIHPLLVKMRDDKHGAPFVDDEDVPDELKSTSAPPKKNEWDTDANWHKRWEYVMEEMVWAFGQILDDSEEPIYDGQNGEYTKYSNRCQNGYRLFGKYLRALWT